MMLTCRLSDQLDHDIIQEIDAIPKRDRSRTIREALRAFFYGQNINTTGNHVDAHRIKLSLSDDDLKGGDVDLEDELEKTLSSF
jgi:hypothetical protein